MADCLILRRYFASPVFLGVARESWFDSSVRQKKERRFACVFIGCWLVGRVQQVIHTSARLDAVSTQKFKAFVLVPRRQNYLSCGIFQASRSLYDLALRGYEKDVLGVCDTCVCDVVGVCSRRA